MSNHMQSTAKESQWYKDAIIYELHIKAFADSNKDGVGDFKGLLTKLDYLQELGVTTIWLLPFYPSPSAIASGERDPSHEASSSLWRTLRAREAKWD